MRERKTTRRIAGAVFMTAVTVMALAAAGRLHAAPATTHTPDVRAVLRIDGLNGNNPTPITGFSLGATNTTSTGGAGGGAGKVVFSDLAVTKLLDGVSVPLLQAAATGQVLNSVVIDVFDGAANIPFATYTFQGVSVVSTIFGESDATVTEQDAFDFRTITSNVTINGQTFHSCFDVKALSSC